MKLFKGKKIVGLLLAGLFVSSACTAVGVGMLGGSISVNADAIADKNKLSASYKRVDKMVPQTEYQSKTKDKMLVYYANLLENYDSLSASEKTATMKGLTDKHNAFLNDYYHTEIEATPHVMSIGMLSDVHVTTTGVGVSKFLNALEDIKSINPDVAAVGVLGDLSDNGVCVANPAKGDLDDYYNMVDSVDFKNSKGEDIPILSIMGNHDVRGPEYIPANYQPAVDMYLEREGVDSLCWDTWINGYHFIMLNTAIYQRDDCYLTAENIRWLDETLSEKESNKPQFVLIHQQKSVVHTATDSPYTFEEVIERHPSAIVSSGHTHDGFEINEIVQEGKGTYINQPGLYGNGGDHTYPAYYFVDVYEGGVIFRARNATTEEWVPVGDVAVFLDDMQRTYAFFNDDGSLIESKSVETGEIVALPKNPTKADDDGYTYTFKGWDINGDGRVDGVPTQVVVSINATAVYTKKAKTFSYKFIGADGSTLSSGDKAYGEAYSFPTVANLLGWDINGDGIAESLPKTVSGALEAKAILNDSGKPIYTFTDLDGNVYAKAAISDYSEMVVPADPVSARDNTVFLGWDINGDRKADTLPTSGALDKDVTIKAVFYTKSGNSVIWSGTTSSTSLASQIQNNYTYMKRSSVSSYAGSPSGKAVKVEWNGYGLAGQGIAQTSSPMFKMEMPTFDVAPKGVAIWVNLGSSTEGAYGFTLSKSGSNSLAKPIYYLSEDGTVYTDSTAKHRTVPAAFRGWMIIPTGTFSNNKIAKGETLEFSFDISQTSTKSEARKTYHFGQAFAFTTDAEMMLTQLMQAYYNYVDFDGSVIEEGALVNGVEFPTISNPVKEGTQQYSYTFAGWDINDDGKVDELPAIAYGALTAKAVYTESVNKYTYSFVDEEGTLIKEATAEYGSLILPPFNYVKDEPGYVYEAVYNNYEEGMRLTEDVTVEITYVKTPLYYTYTFKNADGTAIKSEKVAYGTEIVAPEAPVKEGTAKYSYEFIGWKNYTEGMTISKNVEFTAEFKEIVNKYTVTFFDKDGKTVIQTAEMEHGAKINAPAAPAKDGYDFVEWKGYTNGMTVSGDVSFTAVYKSVGGAGGCGSSIVAGIPMALACVGVAAVSLARRKED